MSSSATIIPNREGGKKHQREHKRRHGPKDPLRAGHNEGDQEKHEGRREYSDDCKRHHWKDAQGRVGARHDHALRKRSERSTHEVEQGVDGSADKGGEKSVAEEAAGVNLRARGGGGLYGAPFSFQSVSCNVLVTRCGGIAPPRGARTRLESLQPRAGRARRRSPPFPVPPRPR